MSEHEPKHHQESHGQHHEKRDIIREAEHARKLEHAAKHAKHETKVDINHLEKQAERAAQPAESLKIRSEENRYKPTQSFVNRELKDLAYARLLNRARKGLKPSQRLMSKIIHQPVINSVSEITGRTVGRPSGLLGGGLLAFIGTTIYYYVCQHYGYDYNFFIFLFLLVIGFVTGWLSELLWHLLRKRA